MHGILLLVFAALLAPHAQAKDAPPKVTLKLDKATPADAVAQISAQSGLTVLALENTTGEVTLDLKDIEVEAAVKAVAEAVKGSWLRAYILETKAPATPPTAVELAGRLSETWRAWLLRRSETDLDGFQQRAQAARAVAPQPAPAAAGKMEFDPLGVLEGPFHLEQITLQLNGAPLQEALDQFTLQSGYPVLLEPGLEGAVTLDVKDEQLDAILDACAQPAQARWRAFYLVGQPHPVSQKELDQRLAEGLAQAAGWFFQQPPERRQQLIQEVTQRMQGLSPEERDRIRQSPWAPRVMQRVMTFVTTLTPAQRREVSPILKSFAQLVAP